jgi:hypothetical protein
MRWLHTAILSGRRADNVADMFTVCVLCTLSTEVSSILMTPQDAVRPEHQSGWIQAKVSL